MIFLRSLLYQIFFLPWTLGLSIAYLPLLLAPRIVAQRGASIWIGGVLWLQRWILGLSFEIRGRENLPQGACILAVKHQSAWETMVFHHLLDDPAFILKRELLSLPFIGWYLRKTGQVAIDRKGGIKALKWMVEGARTAIGEGRQIIIFPEGHRQPPGIAGDYHPGIALLYAEIDAPLVPVALNSGLFWSRNAFLRRPGRVTLQFLPPMPRDLDRRAFMAQLKQRVETATRALEQEVASGNPRIAALLADSSNPPVDKSVEN